MEQRHSWEGAGGLTQKLLLPFTVLWILRVSLSLGEEQGVGLSSNEEISSG